MAEKEKSLTALKMQLSKLLKKEQTPEVMEQIDALNLQIEEKEAEKAEEKPGLKKTKASPFVICEEWRLERKRDGNKVTFERLKLVKETKLLREHIDVLNSQKENTLLEYVEKGE